MPASDIHTEPLTPANLREAIPLWPDRAAYRADEFARVLESASTLLAQKRARGVLIRQRGRVRGVGMSVFTHRAFTDAYLRQPHAQLGKRILLEAPAPVWPVLTVRDIGYGNAHEWLDLAVTMTELRPETPEDRWRLLGGIIQSFMDVHAGYRLRRIVNEVFGTQSIEDVRAGGSFATLQFFDNIDGRSSLCSLLATITLEEAVERRSLFLPDVSVSPTPDASPVA
jgi:hypothetical protein